MNSNYFLLIAFSLRSDIQDIACFVQPTEDSHQLFQQHQGIGAPGQHLGLVEPSGSPSSSFSSRRSSLVSSSSFPSFSVAWDCWFHCPCLFSVGLAWFLRLQSSLQVVLEPQPRLLWQDGRDRSSLLWKERIRQYLWRRISSSAYCKEEPHLHRAAPSGQNQHFRYPQWWWKVVELIL